MDLNKNISTGSCFLVAVGLLGYAALFMGMGFSGYSSASDVFPTALMLLIPTFFFVLGFQQTRNNGSARPNIPFWLSCIVIDIGVSVLFWFVFRPL